MRFFVDSGSVSYASRVLQKDVSPPREGMSMPYSTVPLGGAAVNEWSVCQVTPRICGFPPAVTSLSSLETTLISGWSGTAKLVRF